MKLGRGARRVIVKIDKMNPTPIYRQLRNEIVTAIATGELRPGDQLPSVRSLAGDLGINLHTVNKAYAILRDEGYVLMRGRAGAVVAEPLRSGEGDVSGAEAATPGSGSLDPGALAPDASIRAALADKRLADGLMLLALEHKASGGSRASFESAVAQALDAAYRPARPQKIELPH